MRKLVVAGMVCLVALSGTEREAYSMNLFGLHLGDRNSSDQVPPAPLSQQREQPQQPIMVQSGDAEIRLQQAEDQMRQLNGRIEEMSYQLCRCRRPSARRRPTTKFASRCWKEGWRHGCRTGSGRADQEERGRHVRHRSIRRCRQGDRDTPGCRCQPRCAGQHSRATACTARLDPVRPERPACRRQRQYE